MANFGLTLEGYVPMTVTDVRDMINARIWGTISPTLDLSDRSFEGQLVGIVAEIFALLWENDERVYSSRDPNKAMDAALDAICLLTGTTRRPATKSTVVLTLTGDNASTIDIGSIARVPDGGQFETQNSATLAALTAWVVDTAYEIGDRVTNGGNAYRCITAGTSTGTGPESTDPLGDETDGTAHWRFLGEGVAAADVDAAAIEAGPTTANAATITEIVTPVGGWLGVVNIADARVGRNQMTNPELRVLRELELAQPGTSPTDSIRAAILLLTDVTACTVFVNFTDLVDADGMPPHSVEAMVQGGEDQDIWTCLLANVAAGIRTHGNTVGTATDSAGNIYAMKFSRPEEVQISIKITLVKDPATYPEDGDQQVRDIIAANGNSQRTGKDAVASWVVAQAFKITGVLNVTEVLLDDAPSPTLSATIPISKRQLAVYDSDSTRIEVVTSDGTP